MYYKFALLDPRPAFQEKNETVFESRVLGIEVTVPRLAARCLEGNIDPQHSGGEDLAAIGAAMSWPLPPRETTLAPLRPDMDSLGAMAVLEIRRGDKALYARMAEIDYPSDGGLDREVVLDRPEVLGRISAIAGADKARGVWPGQQPLPSRDNPWGARDEQGLPAPRPLLAAVGAMVAGHRVEIGEKVCNVVYWLQTGHFPSMCAYEDRVEKERLDIILAIESGEIYAFEVGGIAVVFSAHRAGTDIGYRLAPGVVAEKPQFVFQGGPPQRKGKICQYGPEYINMAEVKKTLLEEEEGWGGSSTIIGSPQGYPCRISLNEIISFIRGLS